MSDNEQVQINSLKKLLLVGTLGYGKSSAANILLNDHIFSVGSVTRSVTKNLQHAKSNQYEITDCPGFGDVNDKKLFFNQILDHKTGLINRSPFSALILIIKFEGDENGGISSQGFRNSAIDFVDAFGDKGLESLMLLCIQTNLKLGRDEFDSKLKLTPGYTYLSDQKQAASLPNNDIPYVLWDNLIPYPKQFEKFTECLNSIPEFSKESMTTAFQFIKRKLDSLNSQPQYQPVTKSWLRNFIRIL